MRDSERLRDTGRDERCARIALAVGLALVLVALALTLTRGPSNVAATNGVAVSAEVGTVSGGASFCQGGESLPAGTSAIRLSLFALIGPRVTLTALSAGRRLTRGSRGTGWTAGSVTIPVRALPRPSPDATICVKLGPAARSVAIGGRRSARGAARMAAGKPLAGRLRIEYLRPGTSSWWSSILPIARRLGLGHALPGTWVALLLALLMLIAIAIACGALVRERTPASWRGIPRAGLACALIACLNAVCWSLLMPPFQAPDEPDHYAYVEQIAETGTLPTSGREETYSAQEARALVDLRYPEVRETPQAHTISSLSQQRRLERDLALPLSQTDDHGAAGVAAEEPPLYYTLEAVPYLVGGNVLDRLELMRLFSALCAGIAALFVFLFLREALPGVPRAWTIGALGVALSPLLGFVSGALNPDAMLAAVSAALFYCLARGMRDGLTPRLAAAIGAAIAIGMLTKLNFLGLLPGAILGLVVLSVREGRRSRGRALRSLALALAIAAAPGCLYVAVNLASGKPALGAVSGGLDLFHGSLAHELGYVWQLYLPRLPGMHGYFPGVMTTRELWLDRTVGLYGWLDTVFPGWVYDLALLPAGILVVLCLRALISARRELSARAAELIVYAAMLVGVLVLVGMDSYIHSSQALGELYAEPRYLLPGCALAAAVLALAARGAGRRWIGVVGALIVCAAIAHDLFSQLQVIARYYG